jgi:hypothetical protein
MDPVHGETSYQGSKLKGSKGVHHRCDSGTGRAPPLLRGADVAISLSAGRKIRCTSAVPIEAEGRKAVALPGDITNEDWCRELVATAVMRWVDLIISSSTLASAVARIFCSFDR